MKLNDFVCLGLGCWFCCNKYSSNGKPVYKINFEECTVRVHTPSASVQNFHDGIWVEWPHNESPENQISWYRWRALEYVAVALQLIQMHSIPVLSECYQVGGLCFGFTVCQRQPRLHWMPESSIFHCQTNITVNWTIILYNLIFNFFVWYLFASSFRWLQTTWRLHIIVVYHGLEQQSRCHKRISFGQSACWRQQY
jgi:hypothetical protein